jgi:hypothetical protein
MSFVSIVVLSMAGLFLAMLGVWEVGRRLGLARIARDPQGLPTGVGAAEGAVFGLLGLLIAFTFSGAAARFEARRDLITHEANAIGTAWLRLDMLPADAQPPLRELFRRYAENRAHVYGDVRDMERTMTMLADGAALQQQIWTRAVAAVRDPSAPASAPMLVLPALNEMIDITTTRVMATRNHPPAVVFGMLGLLTLCGALLAGYTSAANKSRSRLHPLSYAVIMAFGVYLILELEFPRRGLVQVEGADRVLVELRDSMD